ncbi:hypothetical protein [Pigmentiphaga kullae]|uniref:Uncharacterized protein n=1 Tax=Pigmentiphaga kullae TaxID=151784 RepID=A0A4Q7NCF7_9BURK|nr:hypothetical protein [Pigmentiphaga kullae]RZS80629.1 hypothetical protein EV675_3241 [Pigmentiphaga kullae]
MTLVEWIEQARELNTDEAEIDAAIAANQRLKVALIVARENLPDASEEAVLAVFAEICVGTAPAEPLAPQPRPTLH